MNIQERVLREKYSYDEGTIYEKSARLHARFSHVFIGPNSQYAVSYFNKILRARAPGKTVLSYGCVKHESLMPVLNAVKPSQFVVIDISKKELQETREKWDADAEFYVMDAHRLDFPDNFFDMVVGRAIIHHLDFNVAIQQINRVLKPGGLALFVEPLRDNPVLRIARLLTPKARTKDEQPLSRSQIRSADKTFHRNAHLFFNFFTIPAGIASSLLCHEPDNQLMRLAHRLDLGVSHTPLKYWMRSAVLFWEKQA